MADVLAVIPAKGTSRRLPEKNKLILAGRPILAYTIDAWDKSKYKARSALVLTDDGDILSLARNYGCDTVTEPPFVAEASSAEMLRWLCQYLQLYKEFRVGVICLLQVTSPLRIAKDIDKALDNYFSGQFDSVTTVCNGKENGAVYVTHSEIVFYRNSIYGDRLLKMEMPVERSIDIDTATDFENCERLLNGGNYTKLRGKGGRPSKNS